MVRLAFKYLPFNLPFLSDGVVFFQRSWPPFQYKHDYFFYYLIDYYHSFITHDGNKLTHQVVFCYVFISIIFQKKSKSKYDLVHLEDR